MLEEKYLKTYQNKMGPILYKAFKNVTLDDGIGFLEANAMDDYFSPESQEYQEERAKDERTDWRKVAAMISALDENYNSVAYCFMDVKGLRFFLPVLLSLGHFGAIEIWMEYIVEEPKTTTNEKYKEMWNGLSFEQKICFLECMEQNFLLEADFIFEYKNSICASCGKFRNKNFTKEDAKQYVYDGNAEFYQLVLKLKEITIKNEKAGSKAFSFFYSLLEKIIK
ncbi:hypothetical protein B0A58_06525 [Flavobacterium branchiophilum NBRC 15030 = ATCC 35035]|uniref:Uncharacterized protein n=1 Tax=Flavobacterium branchiophilum TaxID=55197 RepID=A0A543G827_9FLAO|nr:DUF6714 family protein [Flavobacterium branchiophilum]OXA76909.1 hypothetical protein B0A58_06525 [Flavobacterium branchiophilum NBRC 15030 = ATCC 35035]TQM42233.1 hypothetical protein BC670_3273 [Flavobacterium branchiophilum]GEM54315.1 hypothetical protein FB1_05360 [Flavobacterium branchiophilum NBRC 15030 = ATCC 35035]